MIFPEYPLGSTVRVTKISDYMDGGKDTYLHRVGILTDIDNRHPHDDLIYYVSFSDGSFSAQWVADVELVADDTDRLNDRYSKSPTVTVKTSAIKAYASSVDEAFAIAGFLSALEGVTMDWSN